MKIAVFSVNWLPTSETFIYRQIKAVPKEDVIVLAQNKFQSAILKEEGTHYNVIYSPLRRLYFYFNILRRKVKTSGNLYRAFFLQSERWRKALTKYNVQLIHAHYGTSGLQILEVAQSLNIPLVTTFHGNDASVMLKKQKYVVSLKGLFSYSYIITVSRYMRGKLLELGADQDRVFVHYIGTDVEKFRFNVREPLEAKARRKEIISFLQVSSLVEKKGHIYSLHAFREFLRIYPDAIFYIGGEGPLKSVCEKFVMDYNLADKVRFLGNLSPNQVADYMSRCDVFLHHSVTASNGSEEGIPTAIMEAMASGLVVVSTYHAGIPELIEDGVSGFLVNEKDIPEYSKVLQRLINLDTAVVAERARIIIEQNFNIHKQNKKLCCLYKKFVEDYSQRGA